jgi:hypothetical protein
MRVVRAFFPVLVIVAAACSGDPAQRPAQPLARAGSVIAYGTADGTNHPAVVALLGPAGTNDAGQSLLGECTGSIVQVNTATSQGYVLTAAHCCTPFAPNVVVVTNNYSPYEIDIFGGTPSPPAYAVTAGSVWYDSKWTGTAGDPYDFCMLRFTGATSSMSVLALPSGSDDGLSPNSNVEHIGFGVTQSGSNSTRMTGTDSVNDGISSTLFQWTQGGSGHVPGICSGDSGGPALLPAGVSESTQTLIGVTSYADSATCSMVTFGGAMRVTSELGAGAFITSYLADAPVGSQVGGSGGSTTVPGSTRWSLLVTAGALLAAGAMGRRRAQSTSAYAAARRARPA